MAKDKISALFLTKYSREGASSRYRFLQYFPLLESEGITCQSSPLTDAKYLEHLYASGGGNLADIIRSFALRLHALGGVSKYDVIVVEYEVLPYFPPLFESIFKRSGIPYIVNYDDAIFYRYSMHKNPVIRRLLGSKIDSVMRMADLVVVGNDYLADYAKKAGASRVDILPTVVDMARYPGKPSGDNNAFTIGWIGSPSNTKYLKALAPALKEVCGNGRAKLVLIGSGPIELPGVPVDIRPWSEDREISDLESCDVGIMPLDDGLWERGKCALKLIQYMACGLPVVVSPVGMNRQLVTDGVNGFFAGDNDAWVKALATLRDDRELRRRIGAKGREKVEKEYSLQVTAHKLAELIRSVAKRFDKDRDRR